MKLLIFLLGFVFLSRVECQLTANRYEVMINETIEECRKIENATKEDTLVLYMDDDVWPETREGKCLIECFFQQMGIVSIIKP